jgi:hypothetical protein
MGDEAKLGGHLRLALTAVGLAYSGDERCGPQRTTPLNQLFGLAASRALTNFSLHLHESLQHNHVESHTSSAV